MGTGNRFISPRLMDNKTANISTLIRPVCHTSDWTAEFLRGAGTVYYLPDRRKYASGENVGFGGRPPDGRDRIVTDELHIRAGSRHAQLADTLRVAETIRSVNNVGDRVQLKFPAVPDDGERHRGAGVKLNGPDHLFEAFDRPPVYSHDYVAGLETCAFGSAAGNHAADIRRREGLSYRHEHPGQNDDRQQEIRERAGRDNERSLAQRFGIE